MPLYDFACKECEILVEDEFFKLAEEKDVKCEECGKQMEQVILKAPGLSDPGGIGQKWTNDGYQLIEEKTGAPRIVKEKWEKGKNVIRSDVHDSDPGGKRNPKSGPSTWGPTMKSRTTGKTLYRSELNIPGTNKV